MARTKQTARTSTSTLHMSYHSRTQQQQKLKKQEILNEQEKKRLKSLEIISFINNIKEKENWKEKIQQKEIQLKYIQEGIEQGMKEENIMKGIYILEMIAKRIQSSRISIATESQQKQEIDTELSQEIQIQVGETIFHSTRSILMADRDSMLNRMFSLSWYQPKETEKERETPIVIETITNCPLIFSHILTYLETLNQNQFNLCPNIHTLSIEQISQLLQDCHYLGLRRLAIATEVESYLNLLNCSYRQVFQSIHLENITANLKALQEEKIRIEKRLLEIPSLIAEEETKEDFARRKRLSLEIKWRGQVGEKVLINTSDSTWKEFELIEVDGNLMVEGDGKKLKTDDYAVDLDQDVVGEKRLKEVEEEEEEEEVEEEEEDDENDDEDDDRDEVEPIKNPLPSPAYYQPVCLRLLGNKYVRYLDDFLPASLVHSLESHLDGLLFQGQLDLHPGSEGQVVDLIHPSLYPYIKGVTQVNDEAKFEQCEKIDGEYSWLPSEFHIDEEGHVSINSYINNLELSASTADLYLDISSVFRLMVPLFERVLKRKLRSSNLQVIVKAAYYFIPPGEIYDGSWHVEGLPHENILLNGIYYLQSDPELQNNHLSFRRTIEEEHFYKQHGYPGQEVDMIEDVGRVPTKTGRVLIWKNDLQHRVGSLQLKSPAAGEDQTGVGLRKILCFFVVDPDVRVVSTEIVPPQQSLIPLGLAMEHRQHLMNARKYYAEQDAGEWERRTYTFCEH